MSHEHEQPEDPPGLCRQCGTGYLVEQESVRMGGRPPRRVYECACCGATEIYPPDPRRFQLDGDD